MSRINFMGSYSGIDGSQIDALMEAEKMPIVHMSNKKTSLEEKQNAWKDINTRLKSLFDKAKALSTPSTFASKKATSTNSDFVSMSVSNSAADQIYNISVNQLASNTKLVGSEVGKIDAGTLTIKSSSPIEDGNLTIKIGDASTIVSLEGVKDLDEVVIKINEELGTDNTTEASIGEDGKIVFKDKATDKLVDAKLTGNPAESIEKGQKVIELEIKDDESLKDIVNNINENKYSGVKASIINNRLVLEDKVNGNRTIEVGGDPAKSLGLTDLAEKGSEHGWIEEGQGSIFTVNGIEIKSDSNTISGAIDGVTINLKQKHEGNSSDVVTVATDFSKAEKAIQEFVDQYNSTMNFMKDQSKAGDPEVKGSGGKLSGDSSLIALEAKLRRVVGDSMNIEGSEINTASKLGISTFDRYGDLTFDASKFREEIEKDPDSVVNFFSDKSNGFVAKVNKQIDGYISKNNGIIKSKNEGFDKSLKRLNGDIDRFNDRMERREEYYIKVFSRLDVAMMQAESQMQWLVGQVDAMNAQKR